MASKNVTGGIILLLSGSILVSLSATQKGREIMGILTNKTSERGGGFTSEKESPKGDTRNNGNTGNGFSEKRGGGFTSAKPETMPKGNTEILPTTFRGTTSPDYNTMFGFAGDRGAKVI